MKAEVAVLIFGSLLWIAMSLPFPKDFEMVMVMSSGKATKIIQKAKLCKTFPISKSIADATTIPTWALSTTQSWSSCH